MKIAILILIVSIAGAGNAFPAEKHECGYCHVAFDKTAKASLKSPLAELCVQCHPDRKSPNEHKVDIVPSMKVLELPLSKDGKITCTTCHDPHEKSGHARLLRVEPSELCFRCHLK